MTQGDLYLYNVIAQIEKFVCEGFTIFGGPYRLVYKSGLYNKFKLLYDSIPQELINNKDFLSRQKEENIFSILNEMSFMLEKSKTFLGFMFVNIYIIESNLDKMYTSLPEDIKLCRSRQLILDSLKK